MNTREAMLQGNIELPVQFISLVGEEFTNVMEQMFKAMWKNHIAGKPTPTTYWYDMFENPIAFNKFVMHLSKAGWITSYVEPKRNWAEIRMNQSKIDKWLNASEVNQVRLNYLINKYSLGNKSSAVDNKTKTSAGIKDTGLVRSGLAKNSAVKFKYDREVMKKYQDVLLLNANKAIRLLDLDYSVFDRSDYEAVIEVLLAKYIAEDLHYTVGMNINDSRGRAISDLLHKVFNPISNKDARALLVTEPKPLTIRGRHQVYLAIAELLGYKIGTVDEKYEFGCEAYANRTMLELDLSNDDGRSKFYHNIWLERIYDNLERYDGQNWIVPIEIDATASMLQIEGVLLGHKPFLEMTNVICDGELRDAWSVDGIDRDQFKKAMTPMLYGSSKTARELWSNRGIKFTTDQVRKFNREISVGNMAVANEFKEFIVTNVEPKEQMTVKIWNEEFQIVCNRFRNVGDYTRKYDIYSTAKGCVISIHHTHTKKVADLQQFRRYFVTLLVHNLDSQIADKIAMNVDWIIPIYDAFITHPADAYDTKLIYIDMLKQIYNNREVILKDYFRSIGIDSRKAAAWSAVKSKIVPITGEFTPATTALK